MTHFPSDNHSSEQPKPPGSKPVIVNLGSVEPETVDWLWQGRFALGKVTLLTGDPGLGKSFITLDMAARVTTGREWPDGEPGETGSVVLLSAEDGPADTIRPRIESLGGFVDRIDLIRMVTRPNSKNEQSFSLGRDLAALEETISQQWCPKLVVIDPISAYLGGTDSHNNSDIRGLLTPLSDLADRLHVAIVVVTHLNKSDSGPALYRSMGSIAFVAAARAAWMVTKDPGDPSGERRLLLASKNNLGPGKTGLAFWIQAKPDGHYGAVVAWDPTPVHKRVDEVFSENQPKRNRREKRDRAAEFVKEALAEGPISSTELKRLAEANGHKWRTIARARKAISVAADKQGHGSWHCELPDHSVPTPPSEELAPFEENAALCDPSVHSLPTSKEDLAPFEEDGALCVNLEENVVSEEDSEASFLKERQVEERGGTSREFGRCFRCGSERWWKSPFQAKPICGVCRPPQGTDVARGWL
jgi:hypothetical protein